MIKRKDLVKVIKDNKVYYKFSEIQKCEEVRENYSVRAIKEILGDYAIRLSGMGNSKWIKEEDLSRVGLVAKTIHTEIVGGIEEDVKSSASMMQLAMILTGADRLGQAYKDEKIQKIKQETLEKYKDYNKHNVEQINKTLHYIDVIKEVNEMIADYNAEIVYSINDKFGLEATLVAPNVVKDIYTFEIDYLINNDIELTQDGFKYYYNDGECVIEVNKGATGDILWDKDKLHVDNVLELINRDDIELINDDYEYWRVENNNENILVETELIVDDLFKIINDEVFVTYSEEELVGIKEQLESMSLEGKDFVEAKYRLN